MPEKPLNNDLNILKLLRLIDMPVFNKMMSFKIKESKYGKLNQCISAYRQKYEKYFTILFAEAFRNDEIVSDDLLPLLYWFQLTMFETGAWGKTGQIPWGRPNLSIFENPPILPGDIKQMITDKPQGIDRVVTLKSVYSHLTRVKYDVTYVWCSPNHIVGTVIESMEDLYKAKRTDPHDPKHVLAIIKYLLNRVPHYREDFYMYYFTRMYPKMGKKLEYVTKIVHEYFSNPGEGGKNKKKYLELEPGLIKVVNELLLVLGDIRQPDKPREFTPWLAAGSGCVCQGD